MKNYLKQFIKAHIDSRYINYIYRYFCGNHIKICRTNRVDLKNARLTKCTIEIFGKNNSVIIQGNNNLLANCKLLITGDNCKIIIGQRNVFHNSTFWLEDNQSSIIIGDDNIMSGKVHMGVVEGTTLTIKNKCLFSSDIYISTTDSHSITDEVSGRRLNPSKDITINNHVWVGHKASIGKGVVIAPDVIIGGSSYVK